MKKTWNWNTDREISKWKGNSHARSPWPVLTSALNERKCSPLRVILDFRTERICWKFSEPFGFQNEIFDCLFFCLSPGSRSRLRYEKQKPSGTRVHEKWQHLIMPRKTSFMVTVIIVHPGHMANLWTGKHITWLQLLRRTWGHHLWCLCGVFLGRKLHLLFPLAQDIALETKVSVLTSFNV